MERMRVYEIAKRLGLDSKDLTEKLKKLGFDVKNFLSWVDDSSVQRIFEHFQALNTDSPNIGEHRFAGKVRVYELAKEFSLDSRELVLLLNAKGYGVKNYMSTIDDEPCEKIRQFFRSSDSGEIRKLITLGAEARVSTTGIRRRRMIIAHPQKSSSDVTSQQIATHAKDSSVASRARIIKLPEVTVQEKPASSPKAMVEGKTFIVDGSNIIRFCTHKRGYISLEGLLSLLLEIRRHGGAFICIFDANTFYKLRDRGKRGSEIRYAMLRDLLSDEFIEVPGGKKADDFILPQADKNGHLVISNDRFRDYRDKYPWLVEEDACLFKGKVIRGYLEVPDLNFSVPVRKDLAKMAEELINQGRQP